MSKSAPGKNGSNVGVDMNSILRQGKKNNSSTKTVYFWHLLLFQLKYLRFFRHKENCLSPHCMSATETGGNILIESVVGYSLRTAQLKILPKNTNAKTIRIRTVELKWRQEFYYAVKISSGIWHVIRRQGHWHSICSDFIGRGSDGYSTCILQR